MKKPKAYLAKSNKANPNVVSIVRDDLKQKHTVLEYQGGTYSNKELLSSDYLFIVTEDVTDSNVKVIGKGLWNHIKDFGNVDKAFVVTDLKNNGEWKLACIQKTEKLQNENFTTYGQLTLKAVIPVNVKKPDEKSEEANDWKDKLHYLLIK